MKDLKILILLPYYNRPQLVRETLLSVYNSSYTNWELAFIDDGSLPEMSGLPIVVDIMKEKINKVSFYGCSLIKEQKEIMGSIQAFYMNQAMRNTDADIAIMLCDDDVLIKNYLENLNLFYSKHPDVHYAYSNVVPFDDDYATCGERTTKYEPTFWEDRGLRNLNQYTEPLNPYWKIDASQVSWKLCNILKANIFYPENEFANLDAHLWEQISSSFGLCSYTGFFSQYKRFHKKQLGKALEHLNQLKDKKKCFSFLCDREGKK